MDPLPVPAWSEQDRRHMRHALNLARGAARRGEVPVGCVVVRAGKVVASASNRVERGASALLHAEMLALSRAARRTGGWRLDEVTLYTTLEPCPMCAGAILLARVPRVVYGADDPRKGAFRSAYQVLGSPLGNHHPLVEPGLEAFASAALLQQFFIQLRGRAPTG
jgi:tRNA(adenine34) deaminase